jgi:hypothetical protein
MENTKTQIELEFQNIPNSNYEKFFAKLKQVESLPTEQWKINQTLGYFCKKYKEKYKLDYQFKYNNPSPSKCFEVWQMSSLGSKLSTNPVILKEYIDWIFKEIVPKLKKRFTSISLLNKDEHLSFFKTNIYFEKQTSVDRTTPLKQEYIDLFKEINIHINTLGELSFINQMPKTPELTNIFNRLQSSGFNLEILKKII